MIPVSSSAAVAAAPNHCKPSCVEDAEALAETSPVRATDDLERCLSCPNATPAGYLLAADLHDEANDSATALRILRQATGRFPLNATLWEALSRAALRAGETTTALDAITTAHNLRPEDVRLAVAYRALMNQHGSDTDRATHAVEALLLEASGRYELGDAAGARSTLSDALERVKDLPRLRSKVRLRLGLLALAEKQLTESAAWLAAAREDAVDDANLRADIDFARAELALARGDYPSAQQAAESTLASRPSDPLARVNLALAQAHRGQVDDAVRSLTTAFAHGLPGRITRAAFVSLVTPVPWGGSQKQVDALIDDAWPKAGDR